MGNWKVIFEDHFDKPEIDRSVWKNEIGFIRNHEPQYYTDRKENAYVENSELVIVTRREEYEGAHYTSASLYTQGAVEFQYGLLEMRAKLPHGKGLWPAFWTLGADFGVDNDWPLCGEIDVMETIGDTNPANDKRVHLTLHYQSKETGEHADDQKVYFLPEYDTYYDDYHTFAVDWSEERIIWLIDGVERYRVELTEDMQECFKKPHFILVNTALSDWNDAERPDETTPLPQEYRIDYIRVSKWEE